METKNILKSKKIILTIVFLIITCLFIYAADSASDNDKSAGVHLAKSIENIGINPYLVILIIAAIPIVELRGAIPVGILIFKLNWILVVVFSIIGNMIPIFFILYFLNIFEKLLRKIPVFNKFFDWLFKRTLAKSKSIENYEELGLMIFVGIPLPMTGAWTGALIAYLIKLNYFKSIIFIFLGVLLAGVIVTTLTFFASIGWGLFIILGIILLVIIFQIVRKLKENKIEKKI